MDILRGLLEEIPGTVQQSALHVLYIFCTHFSYTCFHVID